MRVAPLKPDGMVVEFKYDPFGRRIEKKVTDSGITTTKKYFYDNEDILFEYDGNGNIGNRYIHGLGIDEPLALINNQGTYYYHVDGLGSVVALSDSSAKVVQDYQYDSFGNLKAQKNRIKQPYAFTGREWDKETRLYYYRARYYDAEVGRFISFDPIVHPAYKMSKCNRNKIMTIPSFESQLKQPQHLNPYVYVVSNPVNLVDPTGFACGTGWTDKIVPDSYGSFDFTAACSEHDTCYETCSNSSVTHKLVCDSLFLNDMLYECRKLTWYPISQFTCIETATIYYAAVLTVGYPAYKNAQKKACCKNTP